MLLVISLDGMNPSFYLTRPDRAPTLHALARTGVHARRLMPVYPTVTFTNHASLVTGLPTAQHGVFGNTRFNERDPLAEDWCLEVSHIRVPTIWEQAEEAGLNTALIRWPTTLNARARWVIPEVFSWKQTLEGMDAELSRALRENTLTPCGDAHGVSHEEFDRWSIEAARFLLRNERVDLMLLHLVALDHLQHVEGPEGPGLERALREADSLIAELLDELDLSRDRVMVVGDHGFRAFGARINLNGLFVTQGWMKVREGKVSDWVVAAHQNCGQAAVYCRDPALEPLVLELLRRNSPGLFQIVERKELDERGCFPGALCAVDCLPGFSIGQDVTTGKLVTRLASLRGEHGYLPEGPSMWGGWIAAGQDIQAGSVIEEFSMLELAPMMADWLKLPAKRGSFPRSTHPGPGHRDPDEILRSGNLAKA
jgi:hypothetical protein